jgi:hypothetical protein
MSHVREHHGVQQQEDLCLRSDAVSRFIGENGHLWTDAVPPSADIVVGADEPCGCEIPRGRPDGLPWVGWNARDISQGGFPFELGVLRDGFRN